MVKVTREHLEAVLDEVAVCRAAAKRSGNNKAQRQVNNRQADLLAEVAAHLATQLKDQPHD